MTSKSPQNHSWYVHSSCFCQSDARVQAISFLHAQGKMKFSTQPTPFAWPCFVVWRDTPKGRKGRVVIDLRGLNAITEDDGHPLPLQSDIIALIAGFLYVSTLDGIAWFHQFNVQLFDRCKFTVVSHRGQEESSVALMGYKGSPPHVQRQTDALLRQFRGQLRYKRFMVEVLVEQVEIDILKDSSIHTSTSKGHLTLDLRLESWMWISIC